MDFDKLSTEIDNLLAPPARKDEPTTKKMDSKDFAAYAKEQVGLAKAEAAKKKPELAKKRLTALKDEVTKISKFDFKPGELPVVTVYKDPEQLDTTETEQSVEGLARNEPSGENNWVAKADAFGNYLESTLKELTARDPKPKDGEKPEEETPEGELAQKGAKGAKKDDTKWPTDLTRGIAKKNHREGDGDYDFGVDPK
jgi:hypothetical protein